MTTENMKLKEARAIIDAEIKEYTKKLEEIANREDYDQDPILIEGETTQGYYCQLMADPKDAARILLKHNFPVYRATEEDAPDAMWRELGEFYGLAEVSSVDL